MGTTLTAREEAASALLLDRAYAGTAVRIAGEAYRAVEYSGTYEEEVAYEKYAGAVEEYLDAALRTVGYLLPHAPSGVETFARLNARVAMMPPPAAIAEDEEAIDAYYAAQDAAAERSSVEVAGIAQRLRSLADDAIREAEAAYGLPGDEAARSLYRAAFLLDSAHSHLRAAYILAAASGRPDLEEEYAARIGWARASGRTWLDAYRYGRPGDRAALRDLYTADPMGRRDTDDLRYLAGEARYGGLLDRRAPVYLRAIAGEEATA